MSELKDATLEVIKALKLERDELKVQIHLASMEVRDAISSDWQAIERRWALLRADARRVGHQVEAMAEVVEDGFEELPDVIEDVAEDVVEDIRAGYARIRKALRARD